MTKSREDLPFEPWFAWDLQVARKIVSSRASDAWSLITINDRVIHLSSLIILFFAFSTMTDMAIAAEVTADSKQVEFFESKVRPLLVNRCYECHSRISQSLKAGLLLDSKAAMLKGGDSGPGKPHESLLIESIRYESNEMPPNEKLSDTQIAILEKWVKLGSPWPNETATATHSAEKGYDWAAARNHWAFRPILKVAPPAVENDDHAKSPIDQFIDARLLNARLMQTGPATASVFVQRAFVDLIGLPPTPDELNDWADRLGKTSGTRLDDRAVSELVDALLERPQYGERWGRHWLDVARYSDTGGWTQDNRPHPMAWRYRDWVVGAFNADMPYDEFVRCQIAGDKIDRDSAVATGFFALGPTYFSDGGDPESIAQAKSETLDDRVDTFSRAFLGLTVACSRCHDHKFDPIPTQDYYSIAGVFNNTREGETPLVDGQIIRDYHDGQKVIRELREKINRSRRKASQEKREVAARSGRTEGEGASEV